HIELSRMLEKGGLTEQDINLVEVPFPDQTVALRNGAIDVAIAVDPIVTLLEDQGIAVRWHDMGEIYPGQVVQFLFYSADFVRERRAVAERYLIAYMKAARYFSAAMLQGRDREEAVGILVKNGPIKDAALVDRIAPSFGYPELNARITVNSLVDEQEFYLSHGFTTNRIDPAQMVDTSFGEQALRVLGRAE